MEPDNKEMFFQITGSIKDRPIWTFIKRVRITAKSDYLLPHVCPSVCPQLGSNRTDFYEIWYLSIFKKKNCPDKLSLIKIGQA
jgi:hypothetical protein